MGKVLSTAEAAQRDRLQKRATIDARDHVTGSADNVEPGPAHLFFKADATVDLKQSACLLPSDLRQQAKAWGSGSVVRKFVEPSLWRRLRDSQMKQATPWSVAVVWLALFVRLHGSALVGACVSTASHALALIVLTLLVFHLPTENSQLNILGTFSNSSHEQTGEVILDSILASDSNSENATLTFPDLEEVLGQELSSKAPGDVLQSLNGPLNGSLNEVSRGEQGESMRLPAIGAPSYAVTKGSFSAWTEPRDPEPGKKYAIVIQVRLPANVKKYRASDLSGVVLGTDSYKQIIRFRSSDEFPINNGGVEVRVIVPGAAQLVRDTIRIQSRVLQEKQTLQIVF